MQTLTFVEICSCDTLNLVKISMWKRLACAKKKEGRFRKYLRFFILIKIHARVNVRDLPIYN